jgi:probable HAF family extracellular repeat protein
VEEKKMKKILSSIAAGVLLASFVAAQPERRYTVIDLGTLGGAYSNGFGINALGDVAGAAATPAQTDGFAATAILWSRHKGKIGPTSLGVLGPPHFPACPTCNSDAAAIDAFGGVAMGSEIATLDPNGEDFGQFDPPSPTHRITRGAIWRNGAMTLLPNLPGGNNANVFWANDLGQVSGFAENGIIDSSCSQVTPFQVQRFQPVIWKPNGEIQRVLFPLTAKGDTVAFALTINDLGETVGASGLCATTGLPPASIGNSSATHAVLWGADGSVTDLGSLGGAANVASSINNLGEVVGTAQSPKDGTLHTFRWTQRTGMLDYGSFPGAVATVAGCCHTINDAGEIVGFTIEPSNPYFGRAVIWQGTKPKDLNTFVREPGPFVQLTGAFSINDSGEIVCQGVTTTGELHACLAVPNIGAAADEIVSPLALQFGTYVPLNYDAREWLRRRAGMPLP